jgi:HD superfamily phosphohydrolase
VSDETWGYLFDSGRQVDGYVILDSLGHGNSGEVYSVEVPQQPGRFALKVYIPFFEFQQPTLQQADAQTTSRILEAAALDQAEYDFLTTVDHPFIVQVFSTGRIKLTAEEGTRLRRKLSRNTNPPEYRGRQFVLPYIVTSQVEGRSMKTAWGNATTQTYRPLSRSLENVAAAIEYLHQQHNYMHADIKADNVLLRNVDDLPVLIDFALSKNFNFSEKDPSERIRLSVDWTLTPDTQLREPHPIRKLMRQGGTREEAKAALFPWLDYFQFGKLLEDLAPHIRRSMPPADAMFADTLASQLTDWEQATRMVPGDLTGLVERLSTRRTYAITAPVPADGSREVPLSNGRRVLVPIALQSMLDHPAFNRLADVNQLSLIPTFLPGASHKRIMHVLETLRVTQALMLRLGEVPKFRVLFGVEEVTRAAACALLHDMNHFPLLHIFQESEVPEFQNVAVMDMICGRDASEDESLTMYALLDGIGLDGDRFKRLVLTDWPQQDGLEDQVTNSLLKSGVDADKLSYLPFDAELTGRGIAVGDVVEDVVRAATVLEVEIDRQKGLHLGFSPEVVPQLESVMAARLANFKQIYWISENRGLMALLLKVVRRLVNEFDLDVTKLVSDLFGESDRSALRVIGDRYLAESGEESYVGLLYEKPGLRPQEVYRTSSLHAHLVRQTGLQRSEYEADIAKELRRAAGLAPGANALDVLVDVPRRALTVGGRVFIDDGTGHGVELSQVTNAVEHLGRQYDELSQTVRIFLSPSLHQALLQKFGYDSEEVATAVEGASAPQPPQLQ